MLSMTDSYLVTLQRCKLILLIIVGISYTSPISSAVIISSKTLETTGNNFFHTTGGWKLAYRKNDNGAIYTYYMGHPSSPLVNDYQNPEADLGTGNATWQFVVPDVQAKYRISVFFPVENFHARTASFTVFHQFGSQQIIIDQSNEKHANQFIQLGDFIGPTRVELSNATNDRSEQISILKGFVLADTIKIEPIKNELETIN